MIISDGYSSYNRDNYVCIVSIWNRTNTYEWHIIMKYEYDDVGSHNDACELLNGDIVVANAARSFVLQAPKSLTQQYMDAMKNIIYPAMRSQPHTLFNKLDPLMMRAEFSKYYPQTIQP